MKIACLSGKGGAGKTMVAVNLAAAAGKATYIDCDVEEPNGRLFLKPQDVQKTVVSALLPEFDPKLCTGCRKCVDFCRFHALIYIKEKFSHVVFISAISGDGLKQLEESVADVLQTAKLNPSDGILSTERQRDAAQQAKDSLEEAIYALESGMTLDAVTVSSEGAISALLELTGERATEAVVDSVFAQFCVGK